MDRNAPQNHLYYSRIFSLSFYVLGDDENELDSYVNVIHKDVMKGDLPLNEGIYDPHMGTTDHSWQCATCHCTKSICPGHFGHVELRYPVKNPIFRDELLKWLKILCHRCSNVLTRTVSTAANKFTDYMRIVKQLGECEYCGERCYKITRDKTKPMIFWKIIEEKTKNETVREEIFNHEIEQILHAVTPDTLARLDIPLRSHVRNFVLRKIRVAPNTIRPDLKRSGGLRISNSELTTTLKHIVEINNTLPLVVPPRPQIDETTKVAYQTLDLFYYSMIKSSSAGELKVNVAANKPASSLTDRWVKKQGRIRRNLMGKRCSNMIRSVITGDPNLAIDQIGIPKSHAQNIEIPETVQPWNIERLTIYFSNRNNRYPGCRHLMKKNDGGLYRIDPISADYQLQVGDVVYRDIIDGDVVCFNRQPSLIFNSLAGFRVKVVEGDTIQLNPMACKGFNADFDGDTCNAIVCQNIQARLEMSKISGYDKWFMSQQTRAPVTGSFLDSLIGLVELTKNGTVFDKWHAMSAFADVHDEDFIPEFRKKEYDGRDLVSMLLPAINIRQTPAIYKKDYAKIGCLKYDPEDIRVEIQRGKLLSGILDKATVGQGQAGGIYHVIANDYSHAKALAVCHNLSQLTDRFLLYRGFTTGVKDINISYEALQKVKSNAEKMILDARAITDKLNKQKLIAPLGMSLADFYEQEQVKTLSAGDDFIIPVFADIDLWNNSMAKMIMAGSKGNLPNFTSINAAIGTQTIGGKRFTAQCGWGRTSPYFTRYDMEPESKGHVSMSFREGVTSEVFPFMASEGRHGAISNALTTSVTGAQNRISIKNLESILIDNMRKSVKGQNIVQPLYGECGVNPAKMEHVEMLTLFISDAEFEQRFKGSNADEFKQLSADRAEMREIEAHLEMSNPSEYISNKSKYLPINVARILDNIMYDYREVIGSNDSKKSNTKNMLDHELVHKTVSDLCADLPYIFMNDFQRAVQRRVPAHLNAAVHLLRMAIRSYMCYNQLIARKFTNAMLPIIVQAFELAMKKALIAPGMCAGIIAAQCISEPMTQFILNSKHRVGGQGGTATNKIVRIQEILGAKDTPNMGSPTMLIMVKPEFQYDAVKVQEIANHIEMMVFERFVSSTEIFFEEFGRPTHPRFAHETEIIKMINKGNYGQTIPNDLAHWCIRFSVNKEELVVKSIKLETIVMAIRKRIPALFIVYTPENYDEIFIRCYLRSNMIRSNSRDYYNDVVYEHMMAIKKVILRGIKGIISTGVVEVLHNSVIQHTGALTSEKKMYAIATVGTNLNAVLKNPYIDPYRTQSDSLHEIARVFGIAAARNKIVNELLNVLGKAYDNFVPYTIFADEMVFTGSVTSIQNTGLQKRENANVTLRLSFQKPVQVIQSAAIKGLTDKISGISGSLIIGTTPNVGTMYNSLVVNNAFIREHSATRDQALEDL